jgi:peptidoglycan/xylan/chitin deacetylase (PgdA/CDA1 family)
MTDSVTPAAVALTFDMEHPSRADQRTDSPTRLLDVLAETGTMATFFIQGRWARSHPQVARRVADDGHLIGSHSHFHAPMPSLTDDGIKGDLAAAGDALREVTGIDPRPWFRCPFGAGHDDERVLALVADAGYRDVHWNVDPADWQPGRTVDELVTAVVDGVTRSPGPAVVLMHTWPAATPAAVAQIVARLRGLDRPLVTVADPVMGLSSDRNEG